MSLSGNLAKMPAILDGKGKVEYHLPVGEELVHLNPLINKPISIRFNGQINCIACGRKTRKSYNQGYCFPCCQSLAACDICIVRPEKCHYEKDTCREPEWGDSHCMTDHYLYLSNTSGLKVGITRGSQIPTRWIDQGATQALPIMRLATRYLSGLAEVLFKNHVADRTDWRKMLKGSAEALDLQGLRDGLFAECAGELDALKENAGNQDVVTLTDEVVVHISYPVVSYPQKVTALNLDKTPEISGVLQGVKGQYLLLDSGVINIRKYGGYHVEVSY
jgi:hypothetical protein